MKNIAEQIYQYRTKKGLSQMELAEMLDVSRQSVSKWETGSSIPEFAKIVKLCEIFEISLDTFILETTETIKESPPQNTTVVIQKTQKPFLSPKKWCGFIFLISGILLQILFVLFSPTDLLGCISFAIPFLICTYICLAEKEKSVFWCIWTWGLWLWTMKHSVFLITLIFFPILLFLIGITLYCFRKQYFHSSKKQKIFYYIAVILTPVLFLIINLTAPMIKNELILYHHNINSMLKQFLMLLPSLSESFLTAIFAYSLIHLKTPKKEP